MTVGEGLDNTEHRIFDAKMESLLHCKSDCLVLLDSPIHKGVLAPGYFKTTRKSKKKSILLRL